MPIQQQQADGSWQAIESIPFTDTVDWEIYGKGKERRAVAYWHADKLAEVGPGKWFRLRLWFAHRRLMRTR